MISPRRKIVICGSYEEFRQWCRDNDLPESHAVYADSNERIMGLELKEEDIVKTGRYWLSKLDLTLLRSRIR